MITTQSHMSIGRRIVAAAVAATALAIAWLTFAGDDIPHLEATVRDLREDRPVGKLLGERILDSVAFPVACFL